MCLYTVETVLFLWSFNVGEDMDVTEDNNSGEDIGDTGDDYTDEDMGMGDMDDKKGMVAKIYCLCLDNLIAGEWTQEENLRFCRLQGCSDVMIR